MEPHNKRDEESTEDLSRITLSARQIRVILSGFISALVFVGGVSGTGIFRVDKFGHSDFDKAIIPLEAKVHRLEDWKEEHSNTCSVTLNRVTRLEKDLQELKGEFRSYEKDDNERMNKYFRGLYGEHK